MSCFPLPLAPFEWYMLEDDRPDYPMTFSLRLRLSGQIRRDAFEAAVEDARRRHPLLDARVDRRSRRRVCWQSAGEVAAYVDWDAAGAALRCPAGEAIDLSCEAGLRVWVRHDAGGASVVLQFHHACCDGLGALQFAGDLLAAYGIRTAPGDDRPELLPLDAGRLLARGQFESTKPSWLGRVARFGDSLREACAWCSRHPAPLNLPPQSGDRPAAAGGIFQVIRTEVLDRDELDSLRAAARRQEVTLNDLLLWAMFRTIVDWNARHGPVSGRMCLRVAMPANLRSADDRATPAANRVTMSFLTRTSRECLDPAALLSGIRRETVQIKRTRRGLHLLKGLAAVRAVLGRLPKYFTDHRCLATVVVSNMGEVEKQFSARFPHADGRIVAGDLRLEEISGVPPLRLHTRAVLMVATYAGRMTLSVRCDPHTFDSAQTEEFLATYLGCLRGKISR